MERNSLIYGISFGVVALFLLILSAALYIPTRNRLLNYDYGAIKMVSAAGQYLEHVSVDDKIIKRLIMISEPTLASQEGLLSESIEQERELEHYYAVVLLMVRGYGSPTNIVAKYEVDGRLVDVAWVEKNATKHKLLTQMSQLMQNHAYNLEERAISNYPTEILPLSHALKHGSLYVRQVVEV